MITVQGSLLRTAIAAADPSRLGEATKAVEQVNGIIEDEPTRSLLLASGGAASAAPICGFVPWRDSGARHIRPHCALTRRNNDIGCHSANDLAIFHKRGHLSAYPRKEGVLDFLPESGNTG